VPSVQSKPGKARKVGNGSDAASSSAGGRAGDDDEDEDEDEDEDPIGYSFGAAMKLRYVKVRQGWHETGETRPGRSGDVGVGDRIPLDGRCAHGWWCSYDRYLRVYRSGRPGRSG
jgi:hypothetical protein